MITNEDKENIFEWIRDINKWINENDLKLAIIMSTGLTKVLRDLQKKEKLK